MIRLLSPSKEWEKKGKENDSSNRNRCNAPGVGWLVRDVVFLDLLDLTGAPRDAHGCRIQEHHRYIFRDPGNTCHRAYESSSLED